VSAPIIELPVAKKLREATESGLICSECGAQFVAPHQQIVACAYCWSRLSLAEQRTIAKATHEELNRHAHANEARARKRNRKNV
jgi:DNA-directed RNA polymerase subunit RPC12/RpoP